MKLRTQLILAFLLLAVVPLTGVTLYSYAASRHVLQEAVEAEAEALAESMDARMGRSSRELSRRVEDLRGRTRRSRSVAYERARQRALEEARQAQVTQLLRSVLTMTRRQRGEVPFAFDRGGDLHVAEESDRAEIAQLQLSPASLPPRSVSRGWVIVARRETEHGLTLGIARPLGESLAEIKRTAVTNLFLGLGMIGLALLGILPLTQRMTRNLDRLSLGAERLGRGELGTRVEVGSRDEIGRLTETFNRMARELGEHQRRLVREERLRKELEMCRQIQEELLPRQPLPLPFGEVKGVSIPAREVGGDFFNYFVLPDGGVALLVGDVSGKGVAAALLMANLQATLRARLPLVRDLAELAQSLDRDIDESTPSSSYLTLFMAVLEPGASRLRYVNAGHTTQYVVRDVGDVEPLESTGRPLGLLPGGGYEERALELGGGDSLFLFTDGLSEAEDASGEPFDRQLRQVLSAAERSSADGLLAAVESAVRQHQGDAEAADDATMVVLSLSRSEGTGSG